MPLRGWNRSRNHPNFIAIREIVKVAVYFRITMLCKQLSHPVIFLRISSVQFNHPVSHRHIEVESPQHGKLSTFYVQREEGGELAVLRTFNFDVPVRHWVIELDGRDPEKDDGVRKLLSQHGYSKVDSNLHNFSDRNEVWVIP